MIHKSSAVLHQAQSVEPPNALRFFKRALLLKCPECGVSPIFVSLRRTKTLSDWFKPLDGCPRCGYAYEREDGYFLLATWAVNYGVVAALGVAASFIVDSVFHWPMWQTMLVTLAPLPVLNFLFVRHSKALFLAFDHFFDPHLK